MQCMHTMHKMEKYQVGCINAVISIAYIFDCPKDRLIWEQEVVGSNPTAPTSLRSSLCFELRLGTCEGEAEGGDPSQRKK